MKNWILLTVELLVAVQSLLYIFDACLAACVRISTRCGDLIERILHRSRWSLSAGKQEGRRRTRRGPPYEVS